jgi:hypothetical protein
LALILRDLAEAGVRPTPLNVIAHATDCGLGDAEVEAICDALAANPDLMGVRT